MKIKLAYPKISDTLGCPLKQCVGFEKYDGTNIHWTFVPEEGWQEYGTRRDRLWINTSGISEFERAHPELSGIHKLWDQDGKLENFFNSNPNYNGAKKIIVFTEYFGPNSFAGSHDPKDDKQLVILDVQVDGVMAPPEQFIQLFKAFPIARVIYQGKFTGQLFKDVRAGKYDVKEGIVVKGVTNGQVYMAKIKTQKYLDKLKNKFGDKWKEYGE